MRFLLPTLFLSFFVPQYAAADSLDIARQLMRDGAPQLALARVERDQPARGDSPQWWQWETLRLDLLDDLGRGPEILERLRALPAEVPADAGRHIGFLGARAALGLGQGRLGREYLSRLLWQPGLTATQQREARRLVAQSYLAERLADEAYRVMLRYAQDFSPLPAADAAVFTEGLLMAGARAEAGTWLTSLDDGSPLKLLARLLGGIISPEQAIAEARAALNPAAAVAPKGGGRKAAAGPVVKVFEPAGYWAVILRAAAMREDPGLQVEAREHWQNLSTAGDGSLFAASPGKLWQAYFDLAQRMGNDAHLLLGEDATWFELGDSLKEKSALQARALFAYLSARATEADLRERARASLAASLFAANLPRTVVALFAGNVKVAGETPVVAQLSEALGPAAGQQESLLALGELAEKQGDAALAADYYLQAAHSGEETAAGKARFQAAHLLDLAGFAEDARRQYLRLQQPAGSRIPPR